MNPSTPRIEERQLLLYDDVWMKAALLSAVCHWRQAGQMTDSSHTVPTSGKVTTMSGRGVRKTMDSRTQLETILSPEGMNTLLLSCCRRWKKRRTKKRRHHGNRQRGPNGRTGRSG